MPWRGRSRPARARRRAQFHRPQPRSWQTRGDYESPLPAGERVTERDVKQNSPTIGGTDGEPGPALPGGAEEATRRMGAIPEGQLRPPRAAGEPRAGHGRRRGSRRRPPVAPLGVERRIPGAVRDGGARAPGQDRAGDRAALAEGAGRGPEVAGSRGCGDGAAAARAREHVAADRGNGGLVEEWAAGAEGGGRRTVRAGLVEEA